MPSDGTNRGVIAQKVVKVWQKQTADRKPELGADGKPIVQPAIEGQKPPSGWREVRQTDGVDIDLGIPDDLLVADSAGSKGRGMSGAESVDVGPSAQYIAGYFEGAPLRTVDEDGNVLQGGSRFRTERDRSGQPLHTVAGTGEHTTGTWALPQVDPSLNFDDPASIEAYFGRPMPKPEAVLTYYRQQVSKVLGVDPSAIPEKGFVFGPAAFTLQSHVTGAPAADAQNVHYIGDSRGNSHFFASLGKVTGTGAHQMALRQYWQALSWGLDPDVARALLDRRLDAATRVWLKSGLPSFNDPTRFGKMIGEADDAVVPLAVEADAKIEGLDPRMMEPIEQAFSQGPGRWVDVAGGPTSGHPFHRGISGGGGSMDHGVQDKADGPGEALQWLEGKPQEHERFVLRHDLQPADRPWDFTSYASPLAVQGLAQGFTSSGDHNVTTLPKGEHTGEVTRLGLMGSATIGMGWAKNYLALHDSLVARGMTIPPTSRGAQFVAEVRPIIIRSDELDVESSPSVAIRNKAISTGTKQTP